MSRRKEWTNEMDDFLKKNYSKENIPMLMEHYNKSYNAIKGRASKLGLTLGKLLTDSEMKFIQDNCKNMSGAKIAKLLGRSKPTVTKYMQRIDAKPVKFWTDEEIEYLADSIGKLSIEQISTTLGRSKNAVLSKAYSIGILFLNDDTDYLSLSEVSLLLGNKSLSIYQYVNDNKLKTTQKSNRILTTEENLIKFMQEYPELWDATKCDKYYFGMYDWFQQKRKVDFDKMIQRRWGNGETTLQQTAVN